MKAEILRLLRETKEDLSGQEICERLGISRTAVWKAIQQLKAEGYEIQAVRNRGYRILEEPKDLFNGHEIASRLSEDSLIKEVRFKKEIDSTNIWAGKLGAEGAASGILCCADMQKAGKGRRGRTWTSPPGTSIYMSLLLRPAILPERASILTLLMGLSVCQAIREISGLEAMIKWPNDVVLQGKKIAGILTEMTAQVDYIDRVVIGVGINVNQETFPEELAAMAGSMKLAGGKSYDRAELTALVMESFSRNYRLFEKSQDMEGLKEDYERLLVNIGKEVKVLGRKQEFTGLAKGIDSLGNLLVKRDAGDLEKVFAGEVSVRGIYGYV